MIRHNFRCRACICGWNSQFLVSPDISIRNEPLALQQTQLQMQICRQYLDDAYFIQQFKKSSLVKQVTNRNMAWLPKPAPGYPSPHKSSHCHGLPSHKPKVVIVRLAIRRSENKIFNHDLVTARNLSQNRTQPQTVIILLIYTTGKICMQSNVDYIYPE